MIKEIFLRFYPRFIFLLLILGCGSKTNENLYSIDGPYIYEEQDGYTVVSVEKASDTSYYIHQIYR